MKNLKTNNSTASIPNEKISQKERDFTDTLAETYWQLETIQKELEVSHKEVLIEDANESSYSLMMERAYEKFKELKTLTKPVKCDDGDLYELINSDFGDIVCNQQIAAMNASNKEQRVKQKLNSIEMLLFSLGDLEVDEETNEEQSTKKSLIEKVN